MKKQEKRLIKKNLKKSLILIISLFIIGLFGLFKGASEFNRQYDVNSYYLKIISKKATELTEQVNINKKKLDKYKYMEFKVNAFNKKYPMFSKILDTTYIKSQKYGFHPNLILGMMQVESDFNPKAMSHKGAYGLMQINYFAWKDELSIDKNRIFDIDYNIELGLEVLKRYYNESNGNIFRALFLYNNGYKYNNTMYPKKVKASPFYAILNKVDSFSTLN
jgi:soluble lytic murein transglycosylase-like protein